MKRVLRGFWGSSIAALLFGPWLAICDTDLDVDFDEEEEIAA